MTRCFRHCSLALLRIWSSVFPSSLIKRKLSWCKKLHKVHYFNLNQYLNPRSCSTENPMSPGSIFSSRFLNVSSFGLLIMKSLTFILQLQTSMVCNPKNVLFQQYFICIILRKKTYKVLYLSSFCTLLFEVCLK